MSDVAQILGVGGGGPAAKLGSSSSNNEKQEPPPAAPSHYRPTRAAQLRGISREVVQRLSGGPADGSSEKGLASAELPPAVPSFSIDTKPRSAKAAGKEGCVKIGNKWISKSKPARKWAWAPFSSSSRTDGAIFSHWVRANVEYPDYPYARFDIHLDPVTYTDDEYARFLRSDTWTKSETDQLLQLARRFELRWPVIHDRWLQYFEDAGTIHDNSRSSGSNRSRNIEDLQHRYYHVAAILTQGRISQEAASEAQALANAQPEPSDNPRAAADQLLLETAAARALASSDPSHQPLIGNLGSGTSNKVFDLGYERERRAHLEALWNRTREEEAEEAELRKELKHVEAQLRKLKKAGGHILAAANASSNATGAGANNNNNKSQPSSRNASRAASPAAPDVAAAASLDQALASTAPTPFAQVPYLQSGRLVAPETGANTGLNKALLGRMETVLADLNIPRVVTATSGHHHSSDNAATSSLLLPTKRVCDLYDSVRKNILLVLILQKNVLQKEGLVQSRRLQLAKMGGNVRVVQEETLMGISPAPLGGNNSTNVAAAAAAAAAAAGAPNRKTSTSRKKPAAASTGSATATGAAASSSNTASTKKKSASAAAGGAAKKTPAAAKRKRKADAAKAAPSGTTPTAAAGSKSDEKSKKRKK